MFWCWSIQTNYSHNSIPLPKILSGAPVIDAGEI
jgi:hypothetical protein